MDKEQNNLKTPEKTKRARSDDYIHYDVSKTVVSLEEIDALSDVFASKGMSEKSEPNYSPLRRTKAVKTDLAATQLTSSSTISSVCRKA